MDLLTDAALALISVGILLTAFIKRRNRARSRLPSVSDQWLLHYRETEHS